MGSSEMRLTVGGRPRTAQVWLPEQPRGAPLVLDLHGSGFDPHRHARAAGTPRWAAWGAVAVAPCGAIPFRYDDTIAAGWAWSVPGAPLPGADAPREEHAQIDDLRFLDALVDEAERRFGVDPGRVLALGFSGGARVLSHWAWRTPRLAGVCCVSGVRVPLTAPAHPPPPLLAVHGDVDDVNPHLGGVGPRWHEPVADVVATWAAAAGCTAEVTQASGSVTRSRWYRPDGTSPVEYLQVGGGGHGWPGAADPEHVGLFGATTSLDATAAAAEFFGVVPRSG